MALSSKLVSAFEKFTRDLDIDVELETLEYRDVLDRFDRGGEGVDFDLACEHFARVFCNKIYKNPHYSILAGRLVMHTIDRSISSSFVHTVIMLYEARVIDPRFLLTVLENRTRLELLAMDFEELNYEFGYFAMKTLQQMYLMGHSVEVQPITESERIDELQAIRPDYDDREYQSVKRLLSQANGDVYKTARNNGALSFIILECPHFMFLRVAVAIHMNVPGCGDKCTNDEFMYNVTETFKGLMKQEFTHATPTLQNAGRRRGQMASCFLTTVDNTEREFDSIRDCALISKQAGGIGLGVHSLPYVHRYGELIDSLTKYVRYDTRRSSAVAMFLEPWHRDIKYFLDMRRSTGAGGVHVHNTFTALWIPDLFMERVAVDGDWCLMDPRQAPLLEYVYGADFEKMYTRLEREGKYVNRLKARQVLKWIYDSHIETGTPYMMYKDESNRKCNEQNLGTIRCSNLCAEIVQYSNQDHVSTCNLASIALNKFVKVDKYKTLPVKYHFTVDNVKEFYDFAELERVTRMVTRNLNKVIDRNHYPIQSSREAVMKTRPIGIGVQGLADVFTSLHVEYTSDLSRLLNVLIFETGSIVPVSMIKFSACVTRLSPDFL